MCRHMYDWNIVDCAEDMIMPKTCSSTGFMLQPIHLHIRRYSSHACICDYTYMQAVQESFAYYTCNITVAKTKAHINHNRDLQIQEQSYRYEA